MRRWSHEIVTSVVSLKTTHTPAADKQLQSQEAMTWIAPAVARAFAPDAFAAALLVNRQNLSRSSNWQASQ